MHCEQWRASVWPPPTSCGERCGAHQAPQAGLGEDREDRLQRPLQPRWWQAWCPDCKGKFLFIFTCDTVQWSLVITRTLVPWGLPCYIRIKKKQTNEKSFFFLVFCLYLWQVLLQFRFDSLHPSLSSAILFSSPYDLPGPPRLPSSVALLLPLPLLPSSFPSITVRYKLPVYAIYFARFLFSRVGN